jgi:hypothetical protein
MNIAMIFCVKFQIAVLKVRYNYIIIIMHKYVKWGEGVRNIFRTIFTVLNIYIRLLYVSSCVNFQGLPDIPKLLK